MKQIFKTRILVISLLIIVSCSDGNKPIYKEVVLPPGNEYIEPVDPTTDDSDQILTDYQQFPDSVKSKIERIYPRGTEQKIVHWGPFRYIIYRNYADGHTSKIYVYLTGEIYQTVYINGDYVERPGIFFVSGTEKAIDLAAVPGIILKNNRDQTGSHQVLKTWIAESDIGPTYVLELIGFQKNDTTAFAYRPDGVLKTMSEANRMRVGAARKWTQSEVEALLGPYRQHYGVDSVLTRIQAVPYDKTKGFRFIVFADNQLNPPVWKTVCHSISKKKPVFAIAVGDLTNDGRADQYVNHFLAVAEKHRKLNIVPVVGNHDSAYNGLAESFLTLFGRGALNYYFDYGNARFIILDNCSRITPFLEQLTVAEQWLAATPRDFYKFVFLHQPPAVIEKWAYHAMPVERATKFTELMAKYNVHHVFTGHIHAYTTATYLGVDYTVTGGAGGTLHEQYGPKGSAHHYIIVDVTPSGIKQQIVQFQKND